MLFFSLVASAPPPLGDAAAEFGSKPCPGPPNLSRCTGKALLAKAMSELRTDAANTYRDESHFLRHASYAAALIHASAFDIGAKPAVLDIGCGAGYFLYALRALGAEPRGMNAPDVTAPSLLPSWRALGLYPGALRCAPILAGAAIPPFDVRFDVVTAFKMQFHTKRDPANPAAFVRWGAAEWAFWFEDMARHHLKPRATVLLEFISGFHAGLGGPAEDVGVRELLVRRLGGRPLASLGAYKANGAMWLFAGPAWHAALRRMQRAGSGGALATNVTQVGWPDSCESEAAKAVSSRATESAKIAAAGGRRRAARPKGVKS